MHGTPAMHLARFVWKRVVLFMVAGTFALVWLYQKIGASFFVVVVTRTCGCFLHIALV
jgi:hypothetical protein